MIFDYEMFSESWINLFFKDVLFKSSVKGAAHFVEYIPRYVHRT